MSAETVRGLKLILRCDAAPEIGMGHVKRCLALAAWLEEKPVFALAGTPVAVHETIAAAGYRTITLSGSSGERAERLREVTADAIVLDIAHARSRRGLEEIRHETASLSTIGIPVVFIDGVGTDALADAEFASQLSLCVRPYPDAKAETKGKWLIGAEYFIVAPVALRSPAAADHLSEVASRILVTTGGGDVGGLGSRILRELNGVPAPRLHIRVIVGPLVSREMRDATRAEAAASSHKVEICDNRSDLTADMQWCDLAVATTGLTKYELALNAVPSILISPDNEHEMNNRSFRDCDTAIHLGVAGLLGDGAIRDACVRLALDKPLRARLSQRGRALIDGRGAMRFLQALKSLADAR